MLEISSKKVKYSGDNTLRIVQSGTGSAGASGVGCGTGKERANATRNNPRTHDLLALLSSGAFTSARPFALRFKK